MIKKYQIFFEELKISRELTPEEAFLEFIDELKNCQSFYTREEQLRQFSHSYSDSAQEKVKSSQLDPEEDFNLVDEFMSKKGFDLETVKSLVNDYGKEAFNTRIEHINPSRCAPIDYYLYVITEKTFPLQGYEWSSFDENASMSGDALDNEYLIRFGYGWHNTKYGKLCIEQNLGSVDNFLKKILEFIPVYMLNLFLNNSKFSIFKRISGEEYRNFIKDFKDNFLFMDDSYYGHLDELYEISKPHFKYEISFDKFYDLILTSIEYLNKETNVNIKVTRRGEDFRISI